jgi:hypothetical protein
MTDKQIRKSVPTASAVLTIPGWPPFGCARVLRSAIAEEMRAQLGSLYHSEWMGKDVETGECISRTARILYRFRDYTPAVYAWDERAHDHLRQLAARLRSLRIDTREGPKVYTVESVDISLSSGVLGINSSHRYHYRIVSPIFPTDTQWVRAPRNPSPFRTAWAQEVVSGCIAGLLSVENLYDAPVHVYGNLRETTVEWSRPQRNLTTRRAGITGEFITNVEIPDGMSIGRHGAEGYGELRLVERFDVPK